MNNINWDELERKDEKISFTIEEIEFSYSPTTESQMFENYNNYMESYVSKKFNKIKGVEEEVTLKRVNLLKLFKVKLENLDCQIPSEVIKKWLSINELKTFSQLDSEEKYKILGKINKNSFLDKLINKVQSIDEPNQEVKKN